MTLEQLTGIEPARLAWEAKVLPLNYSCSKNIIHKITKMSCLNYNIKRFFSSRMKLIFKMMAVDRKMASARLIATSMAQPKGSS